MEKCPKCDSSNIIYCCDACASLKCGDCGYYFKINDYSKGEFKK
jgi:hypothetical protein